EPVQAPCHPDRSLRRYRDMAGPGCCAGEAGGEHPAGPEPGPAHVRVSPSQAAAAASSPPSSRRAVVVWAAAAVSSSARRAAPEPSNTV
ncbi:unnamed protein product, partial [Urochloa humidicola]